MADDSWITESIVQLTRSPMWRAPVDNFVDDRCWLFDDGEMRVEQTLVHVEFRALIDNLLTSFVDDIGVSLEDVLRAVQESVKSTQPTQKPAENFLRYIFYMDDFRSFHTMMAKRNVELDILASREVTRAAGAAPLTAEQETAMEEEEALRLAIAASLKDSEMARKQLELEDVQIQEALALSIAAEENRVRQAIEELKQDEAQAQAGPKPPAEAAAKVTALEEEKAQNIMKLEARALEVRQESLLRGLTATLVVDPTSATTTPEKPSPAPTPAPAPASKIALAPPRPVHGKQLGLKALPSIQPSFKQLEAMTAKPAVAPVAKQPAPSSGGQAGPTLEEMEARAKYMREQREKIVAQNKANRNKELKDYTENNVTKAKPGAVMDGEKQMTVDLARRLREDILREATK